MSMGLLGALGGLGKGLESVGSSIVKNAEEVEREDRSLIANKRLMQERAVMEDARDMRIRGLNKADAVTERARVAEFSKPVLAQKDAKTGLLSGATGLDDAESVGADENVGYNVQKQMRNPTVQESSDRARMAGDVKSAGDIARLDDKEAANATRMKIAEMQQSAAFAKMDMQQQLGIARLDAMLAKAQGAKGGSVPTQVQQINYLVDNGMTRAKATDLVYNVNAKVGEYRTEEREERGPTGAKIKITEKTQINKDKPANDSSQAAGSVKYQGNDPLGLRK